MKITLKKRHKKGLELSEATPRKLFTTPAVKLALYYPCMNIKEAYIYLYGTSLHIF